MSGKGEDPQSRGAWIFGPPYDGNGWALGAEDYLKLVDYLEREGRQDDLTLWMSRTGLYFLLDSPPDND